MLDTWEQYPDLLIVSEVAEILRVDRSYIYRLIREGRLPALRPTPYKTRVIKAELRAFLDATRVEKKSTTTETATT